MDPSLYFIGLSGEKNPRHPPSFLVFFQIMTLVFCAKFCLLVWVIHFICGDVFAPSFYPILIICLSLDSHLLPCSNLSTSHNASLTGISFLLSSKTWVFFYSTCTASVGRTISRSQVLSVYPFSWQLTRPYLKDIWG